MHVDELCTAKSGNVLPESRAQIEFFFIQFKLFLVQGIDQHIFHLDLIGPSASNLRKRGIMVIVGVCHYPSTNERFALAIMVIFEILEEQSGLTAVRTVIDDIRAVFELNDIAHTIDMSGVLQLYNRTFHITIGNGRIYRRQIVGGGVRNNNIQFRQFLKPVHVSHGSALCECGKAVVDLLGSTVHGIAIVRVVLAGRFKIRGILVLKGVQHGVVVSSVGHVSGILAVCIGEGRLYGGLHSRQSHILHIGQNRRKFIQSHDLALTILV